jgi:ribosomal protein L31
MSWWKRRKCSTCRKVLKAKNPVHELRVETTDGLVELEICSDCARFWDGSAEVLSRRNRKDDDPETESL